MKNSHALVLELVQRIPLLDFERIAESVQQSGALESMTRRGRSRQFERNAEDLLEDFDRLLVQSYHNGRHSCLSDFVRTELLSRMSRVDLANILGVSVTRISKRNSFTGPQLTAIRRMFEDIPEPQEANMTVAGLAFAMNAARKLLTGESDEISEEELPTLIDILASEEWGDALLRMDIDSAVNVTQRILASRGTYTDQEYGLLQLFSVINFLKEWRCSFGASLRAVHQVGLLDQHRLRLEMEVR